MKLYYSPGACSLSPHIALHESGLKVDATLVNLKTHQLADGTDYYTINPKGSVPLLELDDGQRLSEGPAIVQYIADQAPASGLAPAAGDPRRADYLQWMFNLANMVQPLFRQWWYPGEPAGETPSFL